MKFLTGGNYHMIKVRERSDIVKMSGVKQIWCESKTNGYSPDERECISLSIVPFNINGHSTHTYVYTHALIQVYTYTMEYTYESESKFPTAF